MHGQIRSGRLNFALKRGSFGTRSLSNTGLRSGLASRTCRGVWQDRRNICVLSRRGKVALIKWADERRPISPVISKMCFGRRGGDGKGKIDQAERFRQHWGRALVRYI